MNEEGYAFVKNTFQKQELNEISQEELVRLAQNVKFVVRSGELGCYSNLLMEAASGVEQFKKELIIDFQR